MKILSAVVCGCCLLPSLAQEIAFDNEKKATVMHYRFTGDHREESMWSALYGAKSGKIYFVGAIQEKDESKVVGKVSRRWPFSMGLVAFDPKGVN